MVNIKTVATIAGVSPSTVSRVLGGTSYVKQETKEKVLKVIRETGYAPNALAKSLKEGRSNTICLLMPSIQNLIFPIITQGVEDTARKHGFSVILCNTNEDVQIESAYMDKMRQRWVDGFILCEVAKDNTEYVDALHQEQFPFVLVARFNPQDQGRLNIVSVDNYGATYQAVRHLIETGHRQIAIAVGSEQLYFYEERLRGYEAALKDHGIDVNPALILKQGSGDESFYAQTKRLMETCPTVDAIFCTADPKAFVVLRALHDMKIQVPEQVSVMGFDNVPLSALIEPPLSTVSQPLYQMGVLAATNLIKQILHKEKSGTLPPPVHDVMQTEIILRKSTCIR